MIDRFLKRKLKQYINTHLIKEERAKKTFCKQSRVLTNSKPRTEYTCDMVRYSLSLDSVEVSEKASSIDEFINVVKDKQTFSEYLFSLIDESGESDADIYNRAGIDRRLFSKIRSNADYQPSKNTIFALAMSLKLDQTKTSRLLNKAGFEFSNNKLTDIIIMFCIENKIYDLYQIDSFLVEYKQKPIASEV